MRSKTLTTSASTNQHTLYSLKDNRNHPCSARAREVPYEGLHVAVLSVKVPPPRIIKLCVKHSHPKSSVRNQTLDSPSIGGPHDRTSYINTPRRTVAACNKIILLALNVKPLQLFQRFGGAWFHYFGPSWSVVKQG
eukprot:1192766-Prorocentrum_minimum.AAC.2